MTTRNKSLLIGCIADDFTGAGDAASFLRKAGLRTLMINGINSFDEAVSADADAMVVALKTRSILAKEAVSCSVEAAKKLISMGAKHLYFKYCSTFDSTPDGNIGPVTDALMELMGTKYTVLCPAVPVNGRLVRDGILYVHGIPLAESPMRYHPLNPMKKSALPELMEEQSLYPCIALGRGEMPAGEVISAAGRHLTVVPPYESDEDGRWIAEKFGHLSLLTGGSGLLEHLGHFYKKLYKINPDNPEQDKLGENESTRKVRPRLLLSGSCSAMTQAQVKKYIDYGGRAVRIDPEKLLSGEQTPEDLCQVLAEAQEDILLYSTADPEQVTKCQRIGAERVSSLLEGLMGNLACCGIETGYTRIVVAGGETSGAVMQALNRNVYRIGPDVAPGVPEMGPVGRPELRLVLKSGNFGDEDFFLKALVRAGER